MFQGVVEAVTWLKCTEGKGLGTVLSLRLMTAVSPWNQEKWQVEMRGGLSKDSLLSGHQRVSFQVDVALCLSVSPLTTSPLAYACYFAQTSPWHVDSQGPLSYACRCTGTPAHTSLGRPWSSTTEATRATVYPLTTDFIMTCSSKTGNTTESSLPHACLEPVVLSWLHISLAPVHVAYCNYRLVNHF